MKILISACLCGVKCKYNGENNINPVLLNMLKPYRLIPVCPETLGGLPVPRCPSEIQNGSGAEVLTGAKSVINAEGIDVTEEFVTGAERALALALAQNVDVVILKSRSPSCGVGTIYNGSFNRTLTEGDGVAAALLKQRGFQVTSDENYIKEAEII